MLSPSLYERDAYQARLLKHPEERSAIRFMVQWKARYAASQPLKIKVEMRGGKIGELPTRATLEQPLQPKGNLSHWTPLELAGEDYKKFGDLIAWRVTLWSSDQLVAEEKSFLW